MHDAAFGPLTTPPPHLPTGAAAAAAMAEDTELTPLDMSFLDNIPHTYRLLASGGIAGCVAKTITAPLSRITILFQVRYLSIG